MTLQECSRKIITDGFTHLSIRGIEPVLYDVQSGFITLLQEKNVGTISFCFPEAPDDPDIGLIIRNGEKTENGKYDQKIFFHYPVDLQLENLLSIHNPKILKNYEYFLERCAALTVICRCVLKRFARELDLQTGNKLNLTNLLCTDRDGLRIVAYTGFREDTPGCIAQAHIDRSALTMSLFESHAGVEYSPKSDGPWQRLSPLPDQPLIFSSALLQHLSESHNLVPPIKAVWHRVMYDPTAAPFSKTIIRLAIIYFSKLPITLQL